MVDHPRGLEYVADHEYLVEHRREILELLKTSVWTWFSKPGSRRVIHYNYRYDYKNTVLRLLVMIFQNCYYHWRQLWTRQLGASFSVS
jgi:hypothetical protein